MSTVTITCPDGTPLTPHPTSGWLGVEGLLSAEQVGELLHVTPKVVGNLRRTGQLEAVLIGRTHRFEPDAVRAFIAASRVPAS